MQRGLSLPVNTIGWVSNTIAPVHKTLDEGSQQQVTAVQQQESTAPKRSLTSRSIPLASVLEQVSSNNARRVGSLSVSPTGQIIQTMTASEPGLKETILLVDDEQSVRTIVLKILRRARYNVLEAENGEAALRIAEEHPGKIDLVITDMYMPGLRGREVVERLAPTRPGLRALFISGYADQDARTGVPGGANFLNKPFSGQELANAVEKVLKGPPL